VPFRWRAEKGPVYEVPLTPSDVANTAAALLELRTTNPGEAADREDLLRVEVLREIAGGAIAAIALARAALRTVDV
jgi:hypothetical protein